MGYLSIDNLYKPQAQTILLFKECYALEKIHGTSAHIHYRPEWPEVKRARIKYFAGGESHERFISLFDYDFLLAKCQDLFLHDEVTIYGEAYGGKQQGMSKSYGPLLRFAAFDVKVGDVWLSVPNAHDVCEKLGIEFVAYERVSTDLAALDFERDRDSRQAIRNGVGAGIKQEGVVLRPLVELTTNNGRRVICKHKRDEFKETKTLRVVSPEAMQVLVEAEAIATEWVTPRRLEHVLQKLPAGLSTEGTREVIAAMVADVYREGAGELVESADATKAIGRRAAQLFCQSLKNSLQKT